MKIIGNLKEFSTYRLLSDASLSNNSGFTGTIDYSMIFRSEPPTKDKSISDKRLKSLCVQKQSAVYHIAEPRMCNCEYCGFPNNTKEAVVCGKCKKTIP